MGNEAHKCVVSPIASHNLLEVAHMHVWIGFSVIECKLGLVKARRGGVVSISREKGVALNLAKSLSKGTCTIGRGGGITTSSLARPLWDSRCSVGTFCASHQRARSSKTSLKSSEWAE